MRSLTSSVSTRLPRKIIDIYDRDIPSFSASSRLFMPTTTMRLRALITNAFSFAVMVSPPFACKFCSQKNTQLLLTKQRLCVILEIEGKLISQAVLKKRIAKRLALLYVFYVNFVYKHIIHSKSAFVNRFTYI